MSVGSRWLTSSVAVLFAALFTNTLPSQGPRWRHVEAQGSGHVCLFVTVQNAGEADDPGGASGMAQVIRACLELAQRDVLAVQRFQVEVSLRTTAVWRTVPREELGKAVGQLAKLLSGPHKLGLDADLLALGKARTRLRADDKTRIFPGTVLRSRARQLLAGPPLVGDCQQIQGLTLRQVQARLTERYVPTHDGVRMVSLGDVDSATIVKELSAHGWVATLLAKATNAVTEASSNSQAARDVPAQTQHPRIDGPFVSAVVRVPTPGYKDHAAFVVAATILRYEAAGVLGTYRGGELRTDFPYVRFHLLDGDRVLLLNRRGPDGGAPETAKQELVGMLVAVRQRIDKRRVRNAKAGLAYELARPPYDATTQKMLARSGMALVLPARVLALWPALGLPESFLDQLQRVPVADVQRVFVEHFDTRRLRWLALTADPDRPIKGALPPGFPRKR